MPRPIVLCANSTCDLSEELVKRYNIHIMPLHVNLDGKTYLDGVDIQPDEIYAIYHDKAFCPLLPRRTWRNMRMWCVR